jgi:hypothetical protein
MLSKKIQPPPMTQNFERFSSRRRRCCLKQLIKISAAAAAM